MDNPPINSLPRTRLAPRDFLRSLLIGEEKTQVEYLKAEMEKGYKTQCAKTLSVLLGVSMVTIRCGWGKTLDFEGMPQQHQLILGYIDSSKIKSQYASQIIGGTYKPLEVGAQKFLEYALSLDSLSVDEMKTRLSKSSFFNECARSLAAATGFDYKTVVLWGSDIRFHRMPVEYKRILYYAQSAMKVVHQPSTKQLIAA